MSANASEIHHDYATADNCLNPEAVHICHKCNACGRWPDYRMRLDEIAAMQEWEETDEERSRREFRQAERAGQARLPL